MPQYRRLTQADRHLIEAKLRGGATQTAIAQAMGRAASTIWREVGRNGNGSFYEAHLAQRRANERRLRCRRAGVVAPNIAAAFERSLRLGRSPEVFSGRMRRERQRAPSTSTLYRFARAMGLSLLRSGRRGAGRHLQRQSTTARLSVHKRPKSALRRRTIGHWERDTLYAANGRLVLVLIERKSRLVLLEALGERTAQATTEATRRLLERARLPVKSITNDNGSEFRTELQLQAPVYYTDPGKPGQRGSVENVIRLLRRSIPRNADLTAFAPDEIRRIERWANNHPRKCLGFRTPAEVARIERLRWQ